MCECEFDIDLNSTDENTKDSTWHYKRICLHCNNTWWGLHCVHDGHQNPCPECKIRPIPIEG